MRSGPLLSAVIRIVGAGATAASAVIGIRILGVHEFGVSVLLLATGTSIALPFVALERLAIRLAANEEWSSLAAILALVRNGVLATAAVSVLATIIVGTNDAKWALYIASAGATACMAALTSVRQGVCRAQGRIFWGQVPNELIRPLTTILAYIPTAFWLPSGYQGAAATLVASSVGLGVILFSPTPPRPPREGVATAPALHRHLRSAISYLFIITAVSTVLERVYPILIGIWGGPEQVALFTVAFRIIQLGLFGQSFGIFVYSPALARAMRPDSIDVKRAARIARRIRFLSAPVVIPMIIACFAAGDFIEMLFGHIQLGRALPWVALALLAHALTGPAMAILTMAGRERAVAWVCGMCCVLGTVALVLVSPDSADLAVACVALVYSGWAIGLNVAVKVKYRTLM